MKIYFMFQIREEIQDVLAVKFNTVFMYIKFILICF